MARPACQRSDLLPNPTPVPNLFAGCFRDKDLEEDEEQEQAVALPRSIAQIRAQLFFAPAHRDHEAHPVAIFHRACPPLTGDVAPDSPVARGTVFFLLRLRWIEKELHPALREQDLRDAVAIFILEHPPPARPKIRKPHRHIEMFELEFHKKIVAEIDRIGIDLVELRT